MEHPEHEETSTEVPQRLKKRDATIREGGGPPKSRETFCPRSRHPSCESVYGKAKNEEGELDGEEEKGEGRKVERIAISGVADQCKADRITDVIKRTLILPLWSGRRVGRKGEGGGGRERRFQASDLRRAARETARSNRVASLPPSLLLPPHPPLPSALTDPVNDERS